MKKVLLCASLYVLSSLYHIKADAIAPNAPVSTETSNATGDNTKDYISKLYAEINFGKGDKLDKEVFEKAMTGYLNLRNAGKVSKQLLTVADFTKSSTENRLWVIDLQAKKVIFNTYVAHGQGSGMEYASNFSNQDGTHASSLGFYVTGDCYTGEHGNSLRLNGQDNGFNDAALARGIVMHAADYVSAANVAGQGRLGRSWGCPAVAPELAQPIINLIRNGSCLFIYFPQKDYLRTAYWLNKKVEKLPTGNGDQFQIQPLTPEKELATAVVKPVAPKRDTVIYYVPRRNVATVE